MLQVDAGCVPHLVKLATRGHLGLAVEATGALAAIAGDAAGAAALFATGEARLFVELLHEPDLRLERNVLTLISNAAVHAGMRRHLVVCSC